MWPTRQIALFAALLVLPVQAAGSEQQAESDAQRLFERGFKLSAQQDWLAARTALHRALDLRPDSWEGWLELAYTLDRLKSREPALEAARKGLYLAPDIEAALARLASRAKGLVEQLRPSLPELKEKRASSLERAKETVIEGLNLVSQNKDEEAQHVFARAFEEHPNLPGAHYQLGLCLMRLGDTTAARRHLTRFQELAPAHPSVPAARALMEKSD